MRCNASTCRNHQPALLTAPGGSVVDLREFSRGSPPEVLPCPGGRVPFPDPLQPPLAVAQPGVGSGFMHAVGHIMFNATWVVFCAGGTRPRIS